jgi:hypothetical protein
MFTCQEVVGAVTCLRRQCTNFTPHSTTRVLLPVATPRNRAQASSILPNPLSNSHGWYSLATTSHDTDSTLRALLCDGPACGLEIQIEIVSEATIGAHSQ